MIYHQFGSWYTCVIYCTRQHYLLLHHKDCMVSTISIREMLEHCEASLSEQYVAGIMLCHVSI